jgi:hypothetical protein
MRLQASRDNALRDNPISCVSPAEFRIASEIRGTVRESQIDFGIFAISPACPPSSDPASSHQFAAQRKKK